MTWPFENDTSAITKKLAKKSLQSEKRRNLMVVIAVALAAFLICFTGIVATSLTQMQRNQVVDTYEAVWLGVEENDIETLKGLPEFERVGGYYMLGEELSEQGYHASYVYCDAQMMEITKAQMNLLEGRVPEKANEVVVSEYFLSTYGNNAKIGDTVTLDTESFHGDYVVTGIMDSVNEKEANTCAIILSNAALTEWNGFDPAGYRAYVHFKNSDQLGEELITSYCREIAEEYELPTPSMNNRYFTYASKQPFDDFTLMAGVIALVLIGGYIVIQSIFRISINDKIRSYGQLRTIGATPKQIKRIVKNEGRKLGSIGILIGTVLGICGGFLLFSKGFNAVSYVATVILTLISSWLMVSISIRKPVKIAAGISPIEAVRFTPAQKDIRSRKKNIKLNPVSMGIANFKRDRKKTVAIVASLSLGGIILLVVSSIVLLRSPEALARQIYPYGDYKIYLHSELAVEEAMAAGNPLNEKLKQEILAIDGVTDVITKRQSLHINYRANGIDEAGWCDILTEQNYSAVEAALIEGTMPADAHSIIIDSHTSNRDNIRVGETVEVTSGKSTIPVTISGVFDNDSIPTDGHGTVPVDAPLEFATEALFHELHPEIASFDYSWNIASDPKKADNVESELKNIVATHTDIALENIDTIIEYEKNINAFVFGSIEVLSWLVFLFGVINLINTTLSNQMSRKQENSVLRSIGLTQKQLCKMNICEGLCYAFFATLATLIVGLPASIFACSKFSVGAFAGKVVPYKFPVLEMGLFILVLFGMELILSVWTVRRQKKQSLIEQMRAME